MAQCLVLGEKPVGADDLVLDVAVDRRIDDQKMIAIGIEVVEIALELHCIGGKFRPHFLDEDLVAQRLRRFDLAGAFRDANFKIANTSQ